MQMDGRISDRMKILWDVYSDFVMSRHYPTFTADRDKALRRYSIPACLEGLAPLEPPAPRGSRLHGGELGRLELLAPVVSLSQPANDDQRDAHEVQQPAEDKQWERAAVVRTQVVLLESVMGDAEADHSQEEGEEAEEAGDKLGSGEAHVMVRDSLSGRSCMRRFGDPGCCEAGKRKRASRRLL